MRLIRGNIHQGRSPRGAGDFVRSLYQVLVNRRKYERVPLVGLIKLTCGYAVKKTHVCSCVDASPRGLGLDCPEAIEPGTTVLLHAEEGPSRFAHVCYCQERVGVYHLGVEFTTELPSNNQG